MPHPRLKINKVLSDEERVTVTIRDLKKLMNGDQIIWYDRAFGLRRYMMTVWFTYRPKAFTMLL